MSRRPSRIPRPVRVRSRILLAAQEDTEERQPVPVSQRTPEQVSAAQVDDLFQGPQTTPEFEKWTKYEGREFTPPSADIDPYSIFGSEFSPPGSPVFRIQTIKPPEEWSPPPQDIDPYQLFGTFTALDAGVSLIREPAHRLPPRNPVHISSPPPCPPPEESLNLATWKHLPAQRFPSRSPTRVSSPPPCPPPEESLNLANWKRLPAQRFLSRSPTRVPSPPPCPLSEERLNLANWRQLDCERGICPPTPESYDLSRLFYESSPPIMTAAPLDATPQHTSGQPCPDRYTDPVAFFRQYVPMSPSFGQGSPGPVSSPYCNETSTLDPELLRMIFHIPRPDRARGVCPPSPETYDLSRLFYETSPSIPITSSAPSLPYADTTPHHSTARRPWVGSASSSPYSFRPRRHLQSAGTASFHSPVVQGSPELWWDPIGTSFSHRVPRQHLGSPGSRSSPHTPVLAVSPCPRDTTRYASHGRSLSAPAAQSTPVSDVDESYGLRALFHETSNMCPTEQSPATAARAFLRQVFGSRSPSPLSDASAVLQRVQSTPVCWPDELPPEFTTPTTTAGPRRRLISPGKEGSPYSRVSSDPETTQCSDSIDFMTDFVPTEEDERLRQVMDRFTGVPDILQHIMQLPEPQPENEEPEETEHDISCYIDGMDFCQLDMKVKEYSKIIRDTEERTESLFVDIENMKYLTAALINKAKQIRAGIVKAWDNFQETLYKKSPKFALCGEELWKEFETISGECKCIRTSNEEKLKYLKELSNAICKLTKEREHFGDEKLSEDEKEELMKSIEKDSQKVGELAQLLTQQDELIENAIKQRDIEQQRRTEYEAFLKIARKAKKAVLEKLDDVRSITEIQKGMKRMLEQKVAAFDRGEFSPQSKSQPSPSNLPAERG